jgi:hypothetical protein
VLGRSPALDVGEGAHVHRPEPSSASRRLAAE